MLKRGLSLVMACCLLCLVSLPASAGQVEGTVKGLLCLIYKRPCPVSMEDVAASGTHVFIVATEDGAYYFVPNVSATLLARHFLESVRVSGHVAPEHRTIVAERLETRENGSWVLSWSLEMEKSMRKELETLLDLQGGHDREAGTVREGETEPEEKGAPE